MPEKNILRIYQGLDSSGYYYYCPIHQETGSAFGISEGNGDRIGVLVQSILDSNGEPITIVNKEYEFSVHNYTNKFRGYMYAFRIHPSLLVEYGVREGEYLDVLLNYFQISDTKLPIFPKCLRYGNTDLISLSTSPKRKIIQEPLFDFNLGEEYYDDLLLEINYCYAYNLTRSTMVLVRILIENLLIDVLRIKYGIQNIDLFYDTNKGKHQNFSVLINNFRDNIRDFQPFISSIDQQFVDKIDSLRHRTNSNAHSLELDTEKTIITENKNVIIDICKRLYALKKKISETPN